jgi:citrate lyase subunit beta-like protein
MYHTSDALHFSDILRAAKIVHQMNLAHASQRGAFGLELEGGGKEMIDAPMLKQVT